MLKYSFFFLFLLSFIKTEGQKKELPKYNEKKADSVLYVYKDSLEKNIRYSYAFSRYFYKRKNNSLAIKYGLKHISILKKHNIKEKYFQNYLYFLGSYYLSENKFNNAIPIFKEASSLNTFLETKALSLCGLANSYGKIGEYRKSIEHYVQGLNILKKLKKNSSIKNFTTFSVHLASICNLIDTKKDLLTGIKFLNTSDSLIKNIPEINTNRKFISLHSALGTLHSSKSIFNFEKSKYHYLKAIRKAHEHENDFYKVSNYMNYGELHLKNKSDSALYYLNKSKFYSKSKKTKATNGFKNGLKTTYAEIYRNLANYYYTKNKFDLAIKNIQKSINISFEIDSDENIPPTELQYIQTRAKRNIFYAFKSKIHILLKLYQKSKNTRYLDEIINTISIANKLVQITLKNSSENQSKLLWREDVSQIYFMGSYAAHLLGNRKQVFNYLEKNKAFLLAQSVNENNYKIHLPNHIVNEELKFRKEILNLEADIENENDSKKLKDSLFTLKFNYQNFNDSIQKLYPDYFENKNKVKQVELNEVQKQLDKNTIVVSYANNYTYYDDFHTEENKKAIIGLVISKDKTVSFKIDDAQKTINNLDQFRQFITKPLKDKEELTNFKKVSSNLYDQLFPSEEIKNLIKGKKLIIIPDNELQNIPFEALNTNNQDLTYLVENNDISYANSMSFLNINKNIKRKQDKDFIGFAPINFDNTNLNSLVYSEKEINTIDKLLSTESYTNEKASKENFLETSENAKIIHLATHANVSNNPVIHFNKDSLQLHELYTYKNNADLVVLSACETNLGEIKKGEGVLSLARGFFYSGSNAVISSLWKVNDATSSTIITDFYKNLKNNQTKSAALNNAKRNYLKTHSLSEKSPYYWASFVLIGDTSPTFNANYTLYYILLSMIVISGILFFFKKRG
ncbi:CHAT domain-containing protein [Tenacibaculum sp. M341]|uniref:CHAT domain-containing protein n=1 Tax=Tenacibaculum sp. M341 TaxID=2530339 RepID=UPI0010475303|nr:CHAT domain-containing tetratricopeptide repeat protein [Tenacibaculum sp. M341]TCI91829.1 CHAT domain-containing protein [Tenacibaculum sp. M341]